MGICSSCDTEHVQCHQPIRSYHNGYIFRNETCGNQSEYYEPPTPAYHSYQNNETNYQGNNRVPINPYFTSNRNYWE